MQFSKCLQLWVYIFAEKYFPFVLNTRYKMHETFLYPFTDVKSKYTHRINQRSALKQNIIFTDCKIGHYRHSYIEICVHALRKKKKKCRESPFLILFAFLSYMLHFYSRLGLRKPKIFSSAWNLKFRSWKTKRFHNVIRKKIKKKELSSPPENANSL